jgi:hypothetical protein
MKKQKIEQSNNIIYLFVPAKLCKILKCAIILKKILL